MANALHIIEAAATLAVALVCSCLGLLMLGRFAFVLWSASRRDPFDLPSQDDGGVDGRRPRGRLKVAAELIALLATSAALIWLSYALARWVWAPVR